MIAALAIACIQAGTTVSFQPGYYRLEEVAQRLNAGGLLVAVDPACRDLVYAISASEVPAANLLTLVGSDPALEVSSSDGTLRLALSARWTAEAERACHDFAIGLIEDEFHAYRAAKTALDKAYALDELDFAKWRSSLLTLRETDPTSLLILDWASGARSYAEIALTSELGAVVRRGYWSEAPVVPIIGMVELFAPLTNWHARGRFLDAATTPGEGTMFFVPSREDSREIARIKSEQARQAVSRLTWRCDPSSGRLSWSLLSEGRWSTVEGKPYAALSELCVVGGALGSGVKSKALDIVRTGDGQGETIDAAFLGDPDARLGDFDNFNERRWLLVSDFLLMTASNRGVPIVFRPTSFSNRSIPVTTRMPVIEYWMLASDGSRQWPPEVEATEMRLGRRQPRTPSRVLESSFLVTRKSGILWLSDPCARLEAFSRRSILSTRLANARYRAEPVSIAQLLEEVASVSFRRGDGRRTWSGETLMWCEPGRLYPFARLFTVSPVVRDIVQKVEVTRVKGSVTFDKLSSSEINALMSALSAVDSSVNAHPSMSGLLPHAALRHIENNPLDRLKLSVEWSDRQSQFEFMLLLADEPFWRGYARVATR